MVSIAAASSVPSNLSIEGGPTQTAFGTFNMSTLHLDGPSLASLSCVQGIPKQLDAIDGIYRGGGCRQCAAGDSLVGNGLGWASVDQPVMLGWLSLHVHRPTPPSSSLPFYGA